MQSALILYCKVPNTVKEIRKKYDDHVNFPAHITLGYLKEDYDEDDLIKKLNKIKKINLKLDKLYYMNDLVAFSIKNEKIMSIINPITKFIKKYPKSGFHLSLAYKRERKNIDEKLFNKIKEKLTIPIEITINKVWIVKRNKTIGKDWYRSKTFFLK